VKKVKIKSPHKGFISFNGRVKKKLSPKKGIKRSQKDKTSKEEKKWRRKFVEQSLIQIRKKVRPVG
jgi:hypothetical protein